MNISTFIRENAINPNIIHIDYNSVVEDIEYLKEKRRAVTEVI
jgi:hypothetical protein